MCGLGMIYIYPAQVLCETVFGHRISSYPYHPLETAGRNRNTYRSNDVVGPRVVVPFELQVGPGRDNQRRRSTVGSVHVAVDSYTTALVSISIHLHVYIDCMGRTGRGDVLDGVIAVCWLAIYTHPTVHRGAYVGGERT